VTFVDRSVPKGYLFALSSMSDKDPPDSPRRRLEKVIPDLIKRAVEIGVEKATEAPENLKDFVGGMKLPKEIASYVFAQVDETKNGLFRVVAKEIRDFLEHTNVAGEMQKMLTTVQFEISTTIRFKPADGGGADAKAEKGSAPKLAKPDVKTDVQVHRRGASEPTRDRERERAERGDGERPRERRRTRE
jgi:hypothetical protein